MKRLPAWVLAALALCAPIFAAGPDPTQRAIYRARDRVFPALVHIEPILEVFRAGERGRMAVTGSGVIFSPDGYVLTNNHVVERAERVTCYLEDQQEVPATVIGRDPATDVAVLKLDISRVSGKIPFAELGDSANVQVGEHVMAMGSPLGLARSVSLGVISSVDRYLPEDQMPAGAATGLYNTWIQTDAAINPGNSGGPLVDLDGKVVGINSRAVPILGENVGFAIPINLVKEVAKKIIAGGPVLRSWIGVDWQPLRVLPDYLSRKDRKGVVVGSIAPGSPAETAGLEVGDIVVELDGRPVSVRYEEELPTFRKREADIPVGTQIAVTLMRDGGRRTVRFATVARGTQESLDYECREWGFTVREINEEIARSRNLDVTHGVIVTGVKSGSFAADAELTPGDVLLKVESREPADLAGFSAIYRDLVDRKVHAVLIVTKRGPVLRFHVVKPNYEPSSPRAVQPSEGNHGHGDIELEPPDEQEPDNGSS
jgi:serine protease Do